MCPDQKIDQCCGKETQTNGLSESFEIMYSRMHFLAY